VRGAADEQHATLGVIEVITAARDRAADVGLVAEVLVRNVVFRADENAAGTLIASRYYSKT